MARIKADVLGRAGLIADDDRAEVVLKENGKSWIGVNVQQKRVLTYPEYFIKKGKNAVSD